MNRQQLARLLRAACDVTKDPEVLVMGSQAVLGTWDEDELPPEATASMEVDIAFLDDGPDRKKADMVDGAIGELPQMHAAEGIYAEGISVSTSILPDGWQTRLRTWGRPHLLPLALCSLSPMTCVSPSSWPAGRRTMSSSVRSSPRRWSSRGSSRSG